MNCVKLICLNNVDGKCDITIPTMVKKCVPDSEFCKYYEENLELELKKIKNTGGLNSIITKIFSENIIPTSKGDYVKYYYEYGEYKICRMSSKSYIVYKSGQQISAKHVLVDILCKLTGCTKEKWSKTGTRRIGNELMKTVSFKKGEKANG